MVESTLFHRLLLIIAILKLCGISRIKNHLLQSFPIIVIKLFVESERLLGNWLVLGVVVLSQVGMGQGIVYVYSAKQRLLNRSDRTYELGLKSSSFLRRSIQSSEAVGKSSAKFEAGLRGNASTYSRAR